VIRRLASIAALAVGVAVAPANAGVAHHNPIGIADPAGDANGAPDIVRVTIANDTRGLILFVVQVSNRSDLAPNDRVFIRIDSDMSAQTGEPDRGAGIDHMVEIDATTRAVFFRRWNGTAFERTETTTLEARFEGGYVVFVNRSDLGDSRAIRFYVLTALASANVADTAPAAATYDYELSISHVDSMRPRWTPAVPRAGGTFRLSALQLTLQTGDTMPAARVICRASLAGRRLRGTGRGGCTFRLPPAAKRKRFVIDVTAAPAGGEAETARQTFRVR
jgi:hypothetical protein